MEHGEPLEETERVQIARFQFETMNFSNACLGKLVCGACERELPDDSYSGEQRVLRQSIRRCEECVAAGNELVLMKKGRTRSEDDDCPICSLPLPLD